MIDDWQIGVYRMSHKMRKAFMCSLCHNGVLGGGLYLDNAVTYRTQKLTVADKYKHLVLSLKDIKEIVWKWVIFPVATFYMTNEEQYKFIIFNKRRFEKCYQELLNNKVV